MSSLSLIYICLFSISAFSSSFAQSSFYVVAPNTIRLGEQETVAIAHDDPAVQRVNVFLQDHPGKKNKFSNLEFDVAPGESKIVRVRVRLQDIPAVRDDPNARNYVVLAVKSGVFNKEVVIPVTSKSGYVFIQTDKPIYTPKQSVNIRVIPLNERTLPSDEEFKLQIRNPQNVIVKEENFNRGRALNRKAFISHVYTFPPEPLLGEWSITALYGSEFKHNSSVKFQVDEYVLPTFSLRLRVPDVILPNDNEISGSVISKFVYGKKVEGFATFKLGVMAETGAVVYFGRTDSIELEDGIADFRIDTAELKNHKDIGWFPQISGNNFVVEATVIDFASGNKEVITDHSGKFSESPFAISFKRCLNDFKPGLVSVVEADVTYVNGKPAAGVKTVLSAVADGQNLRINNPEYESDEDGRVTFLIHPEVQHKSVTVTLRTNDERYGENQATARHTQEKFVSSTNGYLAISRRSGKTMKPLSAFAEDIYIEPPIISDIYFMVVSKGMILLMKKLPKGNFKSQKVEFQITYDMVPSFRLVVFAHHGKELIADSINVDVSNQCSPNSEVEIEPSFMNTEPGSNGKIIIRGSKNTLVGLLAVDDAVYALRKKDLLTKSKMFQTMKLHDLGCGPGGGRTTNTVLGNAGVLIVTDKYSPSAEQLKVPACEEKIRRKREIISEMSQNYTGKENECCKLGIRKHHLDLNCYDRADIVAKFTTENSTEGCAAAFLDCCLANEERVKSIRDKISETLNRERVAGVALDDLEFIDVRDEADLEKDIVVRSDFRETWIFEDKMIGPDNREVMDVSLPHSITTWVIQAVSVSPEFGMCVAEPQNVVAFQNVFLQLNLPYSVVRNEQVEIQAVVFNYGQQRLPVVVYMYGVQGICSGAQEGEKSERQRIYVEPQSAQSVTFPIIALKTGEYNIRVTALSPRGGDVVMKKLTVVAEGHPVEKSILLKLDPTNQQRRKKRHIETDCYSDSIDDSKGLQVTAIRLSVPEDFIPGTGSCVISALGDEFGPTVETSLEDPDKMLLLPRGCGEQNMMFMAPTMYTMRYLKVSGKMTKEREEKGYGFIREGYQRELVYRKQDGSYAAFTHRPASVWLTAFVMKVFCQASSLVHIDEEVMCSGVRWLINAQQPDGSFIDHHPVVHADMVGGVVGTAPLTAFVLITLQECQCDEKKLEIAKARASSYLEDHIAELTAPLPVAIAAYAMALSDSALKDNPYGKLKALEKYDEDMNALHWETGKGTQDIEVTSYALLTYLQYNDMTKSNAIVNWLNTKRLASGSFPSTQDTVIALQALSEYAIASRAPGINLVSNVTSSNDRLLKRSLVFQESNAQIQQYVKVNKIGGMLFVNTEGHGVGVLSVKMKYNIPTPPEKLCKFEIKLNVTEVKPQARRVNVHRQPGGNDVFVLLDDDLIRAVGVGKPGENKGDQVVAEIDPRARPEQPLRQIQDRGALGIAADLERLKREDKPEKSALVLNLQICVRYLADRPAGMSIVDAGIFTGFEAVKEDLDQLVKSKEDFIDKYEVTSRSIIFYLDKTPTHDYCFNFRINRVFIVGNTQMSVVRVYDYYNPEESCTEFYSPDHNSPMLRKICRNGICQCAEGGCPPKTPFERVIKIENTGEDKNIDNQIARSMLRNMACNDNDYVWRGIPTEIKKSGGFLHIKFLIDTVIKEGIDKAETLINEERELLARDTCESAELVVNQQYIIMGKDGEKYLDDEGNAWHRYLLDKSTSIYKFTKIKDADNNFLQKAMNWLQRDFPKEGCLD